MNFMGIDVGTTGVKTTVFDEAGNILGYGFQNYAIRFYEGKRAVQRCPAVPNAPNRMPKRSGSIRKKQWLPPLRPRAAKLQPSAYPLRAMPLFR